jgi:integrase
VAQSIDWRFEVALVLAHETGHRIGAIRLLRWSDVDFEREVVVWRAQNDKTGTEHVTPLSLDATAALLVGHTITVASRPAGEPPRASQMAQEGNEDDRPW